MPLLLLLLWLTPAPSLAEEPLLDSSYEDVDEENESGPRPLPYQVESDDGTDPGNDRPSPRYADSPAPKSRVFSATNERRFHSWLVKICAEEPLASPDAIVRGKKVVRPANRLVSLQNLLQNYVGSLPRLPKRAQRIRTLLRKEFFELREATELDGEPTSRSKALGLLKQVSDHSTCGIRGKIFQPAGKKKARARRQK